jgi:hypothetical protein
MRKQYWKCNTSYVFEFRWSDQYISRYVLMQKKTVIWNIFHCVLTLTFCSRRQRKNICLLVSLHSVGSALCWFYVRSLSVSTIVDYEAGSARSLLAQCKEEKRLFPLLWQQKSKGNDGRKNTTERLNAQGDSLLYPGHKYRESSPLFSLTCNCLVSTFEIFL